MSIRISVVIPAYNEATSLPLLLADLAEARRRYRAGCHAVEVIVADNDSADETVELALAGGCTVVSVHRRIIAAVRNAGGRVARGEILAFIDADTRVHPDIFNAIDDYFADETRVVGTSGAVPERRSFPIDASVAVLGGITFLLGYALPRSRSQCVPAGVICCRRTDWQAIGGYDERLLFAEDIRLLLALRKLGRRRRQSTGYLTNVPAIFSTRKFDRYGDWHRLTHPFAMMARMLVSRRAFYAKVDEYWYGTQRLPQREPSTIPQHSSRSSVRATS